jgi:hypothetical protein
MRLTVHCSPGDDNTRHVRVMSRVNLITELIIHVDHNHDPKRKMMTITVRRTNVPNQKQRILDPMTLETREYMCGFFDVSSENYDTGEKRHEQMWISLEK